jgi:hypothetical protein
MEYKEYNQALEEFKKYQTDEFYDFLREKFPNSLQKCWDFSIGAGWYPILYNFCVFLEKIKESGNEVDIAQVKEKFGGLRIYVNNVKVSDDDVDRIYEYINQLEKLADKVCEKCGSTEEISKDSSKHFWIKSYCKKCHEERKY